MTESPALQKTEAASSRWPPYPVYKPSGVEWLGEIPAHWSHAPIKSLARRGYKTFTDGDWIETPYITQEGIRLIQTGNIGVGIYREQGFRYIGIESFKQLRCTEVDPGDILICRLADPVGRACLAPDLGLRMITSVDVCILKPNGEVDPRFVVYCLSSQEYLGWLQSVCRGGTRDRISRTMLGSIHVPLPPHDEQHAIAVFLDRETARIDALIASKQRLIELLQEKRTALISHAVTQGLDPNVAMKDSGVEWLGEIPKHWEVLPYKRVTDRVVVGIAEASTHAYVDDGVPIIRSTNVRSNRLLLDDILYIEPWFANKNHSKYIHAGDIVTVRTGNAGVSAVVPSELDGCQCFTLLISTPGQEQISQFYSYYLNANAAQIYFQLAGWGTAQINISVPILQNIPVTMPPMSEQLAILNYLDHKTGQIDNLIAKATDAIDKLHEHRTALISAAVTGKIDVRDA